MSQLQNDNIFFELQKNVCTILNECPELSALDFIAANNKDIENEITTALRKQGICGIVLVNEAEFQGFESGLNTAWQVNELVVQIVENPVINRASNNTTFLGTCEDIGAKVSQVLGGADYGHWSEFNLKTIEIGEDSGLLTAKVTFQCLVTTNLSGYVPPEHPEHRIPFVTKEYVEQNFASLSVVYNKTQIDEIVDNILLDVGDEIIKTREAIPTKTSELKNDSGFVNSQTLSEYAKTSYVDAKDNEIKGDIEDISEAIGDIQEVIPQQATSENQLADKDFVNSSIVTNTAYFKGTFNSVSELPTTRVTPNDYAFVIRTDDIGQTYYDRYKYTADGEWLFEYSINNSGFTASQFAAINSGATSEKIQQIDDNTGNIDFLFESELPNKANVSDVYLKNQISSFNLSGEYEEGGTFSFNLMYLK